MKKEIDLNDLVGRLIKLTNRWSIRDTNFENEFKKDNLICYVKCSIIEPKTDRFEKGRSFIIIDADCKEHVTCIRAHDKIEILI